MTKANKRNQQSISICYLVELAVCMKCKGVGICLDTCVINWLEKQKGVAEIVNRATQQDVRFLISEINLVELLRTQDRGKRAKLCKTVSDLLQQGGDQILRWPGRFFSSIPSSDDEINWYCTDRNSIWHSLVKSPNTTRCDAELDQFVNSQLKPIVSRIEKCRELLNNKELNGKSVGINEYLELLIDNEENRFKLLEICFPNCEKSDLWRLSIFRLYWEMILTSIWRHGFQQMSVKPNKKKFAGELDIQQLLYLKGPADILLTNDTGLRDTAHCLDARHGFAPKVQCGIDYFAKL
ncbi:hypothetical protein RAS2_11860 [Phycisphaerae bacterium RAS2]|nr:hypothetical protein RAS2_11860 [Phycisphaerae bacterium RAS2]